jgi:nitrite reductase/ring-hydroxylating ferredoxin subunit
LAAGWREAEGDRGTPVPATGWLTIGAPEVIPDKRARIVATPGGERIAVFRSGNLVSAVTNLCAHQSRPLGEGRIVNGCIVCPWHGYEYRIEDGCAPPPFTEKLPTYFCVYAKVFSTCIPSRCRPARPSRSRRPHLPSQRADRGA